MRIRRGFMRLLALSVGLLVLSQVHDYWFSGFFGEKYTWVKHSILKGTAQGFNVMLRQYHDRHGEYPDRLSAVFNEKVALGTSSPRWTSYPSTPWGTQQVVDIEALPTDSGDWVRGTDYGLGRVDIEALPTGRGDWVRGTDYGLGRKVDPSQRTDYGAVCYVRDSKNHQRYDLTVTGRRHGTFGYWTDRAYCLIHLKNY